MQQHDVHELNRVLFDAIERALRNTSGKAAIAQLYGGTQVYRTVCGTCRNVSERIEGFQDLSTSIFPLKYLSRQLFRLVAHHLLKRRC